jgi:signal peptidase I
MRWLVLASLLFPGIGPALVHRRRRALAWAVAALLALFGIVWTIWLFPVVLLVHVGAAVDASVVLRRDARLGGLDRMFGAIVLVIGAIGAGVGRMMLHGFHIPTSSMYPTIEIGDHICVDRLTKLWRPIERGELIAFHYPCDPRITYIKRVVAVGGDTVEIRCDVLYVNGKAVPHTLVAKDWEYEDRDDDQWIRKHVSRWHEQLGRRGYDVFEGIGETGGRDFPLIDRPFPPGCADSTMFREPKQTHEVKGELVHTKQNAERCEPQLRYVVPKGAVFGLGDNRDNAADSRVWGAISEDDIVGRVIGVWLNDGQTGTLGRFGALH